MYGDGCKLWVKCKLQSIIMDSAGDLHHLFRFEVNPDVTFAFPEDDYSRPSSQAATIGIPRCHESDRDAAVDGASPCHTAKDVVDLSSVLADHRTTDCHFPDAH